MANKQVNLKDSQANNLIPNTTTSAVADVAKGQALSQTLANTPDKDTLGYEVFSDSEIYTKGDVVYYQNKLYKFKQFHAAGSWNAGHVDAYSVSDIDERVKEAETLLGNDELDTTAQTVTGAVNELKGHDDLQDTQISALALTKADKNGVYPQMIVGSAENLVGGNDTSRVLTLDTAGGSADIATGIARVERVKGNSLVWNQLVGSDMAEVATISGHKYRFVDTTNNADTIITSTGQTLDVVAGADNLFDLTQMFGAGNEPATVAEFKALFPKSYYDYNDGEIINLLPSGIKTVGFNAYNHSTGKAVLIGGNQYQISGTYTSISYTDINGNEETITPDTDGIFTPTDNGTLTVVGGNSTNTCVHLVWSGYRNGEYEPYQESTCTLPNVQNINTDGTITESAEGKTRLFPDGLCKAGNVYDEYTPTGAIKRIGKVDLGSLNWNIWRTKDNCFSNNTLDKPHYPWNTLPNLLCVEYQTDLTGYNIYVGQGDKNIAIDGYNIVVKDINCSTTTEIKTALDGVYLYYELSTPIVVTFPEPLNLNYQVNDFGTEQMLPENTSEHTTAPLSMDVVYGLNVVDFVRNAPKNYISKESMSNFLTELGTAMGGTWSMTWNATTEKYNFDFTATPEPESEPEA